MFEPLVLEDPSPAIAGLVAAVDRVIGSACQNESDLIHLEHQIQRLKLHHATQAAEHAASQAFHHGTSNTVEWLRHSCKMSAHEADDRLRVGTQITQLPAVRLALETGRIGYGHVSLICSVAASLQGSRKPVPVDETYLLILATQHSVSRFRHDCQAYRAEVASSAFAEEQRAAVERRSLYISRPDPEGMVKLGGILDELGGTVVRTALEALARRQGVGDDRDKERRQADALVELCEHGLDSGLVPARPGGCAHLQVVVPLEALQGVEGAPAAELEYSHSLGRPALQRFLCNASLSLLALDQQGNLVGAGRARRLPSSSQRRALRRRDRTCRWPGCDRPAMWTSPHHLVPWVEGGPTTLQNLVCLCSRHHWMVHEGGWQIALCEDKTSCRVMAPPGRPYHHLREPDEVLISALGVPWVGVQA